MSEASASPTPDVPELTPGGIVCAQATLVVSGVLCAAGTILWVVVFILAALPGFAAGGGTAGILIVTGALSFGVFAGFILLCFAAAARLHSGRRVIPALVATLFLSLPPLGTAIGIIVFAGLFNSETNAWVERRTAGRE
jgi:hypothetical protein